MYVEWGRNQCIFQTLGRRYVVIIRKTKYQNANINGGYKTAAYIRICKNLMSIFKGFQGAVTQWYSQCTFVLELAGSIPAPVIVELL